MSKPSQSVAEALRLLWRVGDLARIVVRCEEAAVRERAQDELAHAVGELERFFVAWFFADHPEGSV